MEVLLSAQDAAKQMNVSKKTLFKWCAEKRLNYISLPGYVGKDGSKHLGPYKFRQAAIDLFVAQHEIKATNNTPVVRWKPQKRKAA